MIRFSLSSPGPALCLVLVTAVVLLMPRPVSAGRGTESDDESTTYETVVTASRGEEAAFESPRAVRVVGRHAIREGGLTIVRSARSVKPVLRCLLLGRFLTRTWRREGPPSWPPRGRRRCRRQW